MSLLALLRVLFFVAGFAYWTLIHCCASFTAARIVCWTLIHRYICVITGNRPTTQPGVMRSKVLQVLPQILQVFRSSIRLLPTILLTRLSPRRLFTIRQFFRAIWHVARKWTTSLHSRHDLRIAFTRITLGKPNGTAIYVLFKIAGTGTHATVLLC